MRLNGVKTQILFKFLQKYCHGEVLISPMDIESIRND